MGGGEKKKNKEKKKSCTSGAGLMLVWIAFIPGGQYSLEAMMGSGRAFVMRTSSLSQFLVALWTPKILYKPGEV